MLFARYVIDGFCNIWVEIHLIVWLTDAHVHLSAFVWVLIIANTAEIHFRLFISFFFFISCLGCQCSSLGYILHVFSRSLEARRLIEPECITI